MNPRLEVTPAEAGAVLEARLRQIYREFAGADLPQEAVAAAHSHCTAADGGTMLIESKCDDGRTLQVSVDPAGQISAGMS